MLDEAAQFLEEKELLLTEGNIVNTQVDKLFHFLKFVTFTEMYLHFCKGHTIVLFCVRYVNSPLIFKC